MWCWVCRKSFSRNSPTFRLYHGETAALEGPIVSQLLERFVAFPEAVIGVLKQLDPGEGLFRSGDDPTVLLIVSGQKVGFVYVEISCLDVSESSDR